MNEYLALVEAALAAPASRPAASRPAANPALCEVVDAAYAAVLR